MVERTQYSVVVVGSGPAGLAAAHRLRGSGIRYAIIDAGQNVRLRVKDDEVSLTEGHGGTGLYSDGKFSFFPSATALWGLANRADLKNAYEWVRSLLTGHGLTVPPFPENPSAYSFENGKWILKDYPSNYISLDGRVNLIESLVDQIDGDVLNGIVAERICCAPDSRYVVQVTNSAGNRYEIFADCLVLGTGRFGPLSQILESDQSTFHRLEVGFRIEQPSSKAFFAHLSQLDPKLRFASSTNDVEWRTFCACRDGDTVFTRTQNLWTVSGHSDCYPSGKSNVGFNTRIINENVARDAILPALKSMKKRESYFRVSAREFIEGGNATYELLENVYGHLLVPYMREGLTLLSNEYASILDNETVLIGPTLEGIGWYPSINDDLSIKGRRGMWVVGDACGAFRGIVAALVSGYYAASSVLRFVNNKA